jgi:hypothetical protein
MDNFDLKTEPKVKRKPLIWNILTILVLLGTCCLVYYFVAIFINPISAYNPFPPVPSPTLYQTPTYTPTIIPQPATWTPTFTVSPVPTRTKAPTWTSVPLEVSPSDTPTTTPTIENPAFTPTAFPASADITYEASTTMHPDLACKWMGIGGKVVNADNTPLLFQTIQLGGTLDGKVINSLVLSGSIPAYGKSGFEFEKLGDNPIASTHTLWIQLFDNNGRPLTEKTYFDTYDDCAKNLVMIVFTKAR